MRDGSKTVRKLMLMVSVWGASLAISFGLRRWGDLRPEPLQPSWPVVMAAVLLPALSMGAWLLVQSRADHERGESVDSDQETR